LPAYDTDVNAVYHVAQNTNGWPSGVSGWEGNDTKNPLDAGLRTYKPQSYAFSGSFFGEVHFLKQLYYKLNVGLSYNNDFSSIITPRYYSGNYASNAIKKVEESGGYGSSVILENTLNYNGSFGKHNITAVAGVSKQRNQSENYGLGTFMPNDIVSLISNGSSDANRFVSGGNGDYKITSQFGRVNYDYDGKYLLSATIRRDGSSNFGPDHKFGVFPAFSAGWRISKESFMAGVKAISDLKLFGSWGKLGFESIPAFSYLPQVYVGGKNYNLGGNGTGNEIAYPGSDQNGFPNPGIQWQANVTTNIGVNLGLFNNMFTLDAEYYIKKTDKLLLNETIPASSGFGGILLNAGAVENKGVDIQLTYHKVIGDLKLDVTGNVSTVKNKVTSLGAQNSPIKDGIVLPNQIPVTQSAVGHPIGSFWGLQYLGICQDTTGIAKIPGTRPGDCRYADISGPDSIPDGKIDSKDQTYIGNPWPKAIYGLTINASYKGFDMTVFFQGVYGNDILNEEAGFWSDGYQGRYNAETKVLNAWTPQNTSTSEHRIGNLPVNYAISSRMIEKGSYLKVKNLQIGYTIPSAISGKLGVSMLRVYLSATNLITFTKYSGFDPEIGARYNSNTIRGIDQGCYPQARTVVGGLQINF